MYELYKLNDDLYQIHSAYSNEKAMEGTLVGIMTYCTYVLKFDPKELEFALLLMMDSKMDSAHFGINRTCIYTFNKVDKDKKAS